MGEIADAMLDGTLCEACGEYIGSNAGFPAYCSPQCAAARGEPWFEPDWIKERDHAFDPKPFVCECGKRFASDEAMRQHAKAKGHDPV